MRKILLKTQTIKESLLECYDELVEEIDDESGVIMQKIVTEEQIVTGLNLNCDWIKDTIEELT